MALFFQAPLPQQPAVFAGPSLGALPAFVLLLSLLLVLLSFVRRRLESGLLKEPRRLWRSSSSALRLLRQRAHQATVPASDVPVTSSEPPEALETDETVAVTVEEAAEAAADCGADCAAWGCAECAVYSSSLLLAHREIGLRASRGPPGLERCPELAREPPRLPRSVPASALERPRAAASQQPATEPRPEQQWQQWQQWKGSAVSGAEVASPQQRKKQSGKGTACTEGAKAQRWRPRPQPALP